MATSSRTTSRESAASNQRSRNGSVNSDSQERAAEISGPPSPTSATKRGPSLASAGRVPSHSLLSAPQNAALPNRKSRFADVGTIGGNIGRASISMPPPATKPSSIYKPSTVRRPSAMQNTMEVREMEGGMDGIEEGKVSGDTSGMEDLEKTRSTTSLPGSQSASASEQHSPSAFSDSALKPPTSNLNKPGDRLSFSSLYSLGSALYSGAANLTSAPQSAASSTAGSIKSGISDQPTHIATPLSPSLGAGKGEAASLATTATDLVSVIANSQPLHQGSNSFWNLTDEFGDGLTGVGSARQCPERTSIRYLERCC